MNNFIKLPEEFKRKWIEALRSNLYLQGKEYLYNNKINTYCCLGVAGIVCGLTKEEMNNNEYLNDEIVPEALYGDGEEDTQTIPVQTLVSMNDSGRYSFNQIADFIEKEL